MSLEILSLLSQFENVDDRETEAAYYRTRVPWVGPLAYLNTIFKPAPEDILPDVAQKLRMPLSLVRTLRTQNGADLFSGALGVYGVHRPGQLLHRDDPFFDLPFNIEDENYDWPPYDENRFLAIAGYGFDGSSACISREDSSIYLFGRAEDTLAREPTYSWPSIDDWLSSEITRLSFLFDKRGKRLVGESQTLPKSTRPL